MKRTQLHGRRLVLVLALAGLANCRIAAQSPAPKQTRETRALNQYVDSVYGVSFRYPKNFVLKKGELVNDPGLGYLGAIPTAFVQTGGARIATVEIPAGSYPNTDFVTAFFSVSVHPSLTQEQCRQFNSVQDSPKRRNLELSGWRFEGIDDGEAAMSHQFGGTFYHGYSGGRCFELSYGLATAGFGAVDGMKHVDDKAIMAQLESILRTLKIASPVTHSRPLGNVRQATPLSAILEAFGLTQTDGVLVSTQ